jgi:hypothetical protein
MVDEAHGFEFVLNSIDLPEEHPEPAIVLLRRLDPRSRCPA